MSQLRIASVTDLPSAIIAIRDLENALQQLLGAFETSASAKVATLTPEGQIEMWDLVSTGGVTITKDAANKRITIHVP